MTLPVVFFTFLGKVAYSDAAVFVALTLVQWPAVELPVKFSIYL